MLEKSIDEFEALFEQASIPVLNIREIELKRITVVMKGTPLDETVIRLGQYLQQRFGAEVLVRWPATLDGDGAAKMVQSAGLTPADTPFHSTAELVGQISIGWRQLLVIPEPDEESYRVLDIDRLVKGAAPPILLVRNDIDDPKRIFQSILHSLTGNFRQTENFAFSFTLADEDGGKLLLLHAIDEDDLTEVRAALRVSPKVPADGKEELLACLTRQGEKYLKAVVAASRTRSYDVSYRLTIGEVVPTVKAELARGGHTLLVVGHHHEGRSFVEAADYELIHEIRDIPVLAL